MSNKSIRMNAVINMVRIGATMLFPLISFPYTARVLGPAGVGKINFANSVIAYFLLLAAIGIPLYGTREVSKVRNDHGALSDLIKELLVLHFASSIVALIPLTFLVLFVPKINSEFVLFIVASFAIPLSVLTLDWLYQGLEDFVYITIRSVVFLFLSTLALFVFIHDPEDYVIAAGIAIASSVGSSILNFWNARKLIFSKRHESWNLRRHVKPLFKGHLLNFVISVYVNLDTVMLGFMSTAVSVGYYSSALKLSKMLLSMVSSFSSVLLPRLSFYLANGQQSEFDRMLRQSLGTILLLCIPLTAALMVLRSEIILIFAGPQYLQASICVAITAPLILIIGLNGIYGFQVLYAMGREISFISAVAIGAVANVVINLILIPKLAHVGAAWGATIAELLVLIAEILLVNRFYKIQWPFMSMFRYLIAAVFMCGGLLAILSYLAGTPSWMRLLVAVPVGSAIYFSVLIIYRDPLFLQNLEPIKNKLKGFNIRILGGK